MHVPELTSDEYANLPMLEERGEALPRNLLLLADHSPFGRFEDRVLAPGPPFRVTLLREPFDRFESFYHFCVRAGFLRKEWSQYVDDLARMPREVLESYAEYYLSLSSYTYWFDPDHRNPRTALDNLSKYDVVAPFDSFDLFASVFNARNPYSLRFEAHEQLHTNSTLRRSRFAPSQRSLVRDLLAVEYELWDSPRWRSNADGESSIAT